MPRLETLAHPGCDGEATFFRAAGDCLCPKCGLEYRRHPYCGNTPDWEGNAVLHVLCSGEHVKL
jgi:hypothetical protein